MSMQLWKRLEITAYEPKPKEYIYDNDEELLGKDDEELSKNSWDKEVFSRILDKFCGACLAFWKALD
ncbi:4701_t:CDS:2 [Entrophospora sp. SA101]|nr:6576_t:CDS:2 [Entrophospora sp. SA101]CAJ0635379.1 4701_t:CDS:2 [Entrophospora sp. SA101]CAJ0859153.1 21057_t:CDS:2 [Entrophospora sp. SA101]CAJ0893990.1 11031_t:CDS:2 [Entrophospora sp. SA101]